MKQHLWERLKDRLERDPEIEKISEMRNGRPEEHWNMKLHFWQILDGGDIETLKDPELIMDMLKWYEKVWEADGVRWRISHGSHCLGCHGKGHKILQCPLRPYISPIDHHPDDYLPPEATGWLVELRRRERKGKERST